MSGGHFVLPKSHRRSTVATVPRESSMQPPRARPVARRDDKRVRDVPGKAAACARGKERLW
jgi:hypothetical protein